MMWTNNPVADAERYHQQETANMKMWASDHYKGLCPLCHQEMWTDTWEEPEVLYQEVEEWEAVHKSCYEDWLEEQEECTA